MKAFFAVATIIASMATYFSSESKILFYGLFVFFLLSYLLLRRSLTIRLRHVNVLAFLYMVFSVFSIILNLSVVSLDMVQTLLYPIVFMLVLAGGRDLIYDLGTRGAKVVISFFVLNALVAIMTVLGVLESLPLFGEIVRGRYIFGTNIASSAGLICNVNYYAVTQLVGFWVCMFCYERYQLRRKWFWITLFVCCSVIIGSSRSCTATLLLSLLMYLYFKLGRNGKMIYWLCVGAVVMASGFIVRTIMNNEWLYTTLRIYRGLNNRDDLWLLGWKFVLDSPFFGIGSIEQIKNLMMENLGWQISSVQNSFLFSLLRIGFLGTGVVVMIIIIAILRFLTHRDKSETYIICFCTLSAVLMDSMVRTYTLGGIGFVPVVMSICISILVYGDKRLANTYASRSMLNSICSSPKSCTS